MVGPVYNGSYYNDNILLSILHRSSYGTAGAISYTSSRGSEADVGRDWIRLALTVCAHSCRYDHVQPLTCLKITNISSDIVLGKTVKGLSDSGSAGFRERKEFYMVSRRPDYGQPPGPPFAREQRIRRGTQLVRTWILGITKAR